GAKSSQVLILKSFGINILLLVNGVACISCIEKKSHYQLIVGFYNIKLSLFYPFLAAVVFLGVALAFEVLAAVALVLLAAGFLAVVFAVLVVAFVAFFFLSVFSSIVSFSNPLFTKIFNH